jgi:hypothetical protein
LSAAKLSLEKAREALEAYYANGQNSAAAARVLGLSSSTFKDRYYTAVSMAARGEFGTDPVIPGFAISKVTTVTNEDGDTVREFIQQKPAHGGPFNLPEGHSIKGVSALLDASGNVTQQWVKTKEDGENPQAIADAIRAALEGFEPAPALTPPRYKEDDLATIYPVADFHIGLLAWRKEVGQDYDLTIAQRVIKGAAERLLSASPFSEQAVILGLGDLLHADNFKNQTPQSGNQLDVDGRYPKSLRVATELLLHIISQALQRHEKVLVRILPGNHDEQSSIAVSLALAMYYANEPRVTVDDSPSRFWFWSWGDVLLGATHGDKAKMADLPLIMASRNAEAWGRSKFRHLYTGHIHTQTGIEKSGVTVESFQTPAAADAWHHGMGYGAGRSLTAITHHKKLGEILRNKVNIVGE